jgi:phage/plasmid-like protein (TIGR03299 family)
MHELEIDENTGRAAFVSGRNLDAWHRLGQVLPGGLTADQVLDEAHLRGCDIRKVQHFVPLEQLTPDGVTTELVPVPGQFTIVRNNPFTGKAEVLGAKTETVTRDGVDEIRVINPGASVGTVYKAFQNEQAVDFMAAVTDTYSDAEYETAGSIRGGAQVFVSMKLKGFMVGGVDAVDLYLIYLLNHTTGANKCFASHIRPVCANTVDAAQEAAKFTFRHSASLEQRHQEARDALRLSFGYSEAFQAEADKMIAEKISLDSFQKVVEKIWPAVAEEASDQAKKAMVQRNYQLKELFLFSDTQEDVRGTHWAAYNAIVEYMDHLAPSGGVKPEEKAEARALRTIGGVKEKEKAFALLKV